MKRIMKMAVVAVAIMLGSSWRSDLAAQPYPPDETYYQDGDVTYQTFYDELSPHGQWVDHPQYGYIWLPDAGPDFRPYSTSGHWVWTDNFEWMWVSDYDWGWAPFHYGRWDNDPYYGWFWVPGYEWSPAWVAWRDGGDYYGWAPLRPGISISINFSIGSYSPPYDFWSFTPRQYILYPNVYRHCVDYRQNVTIINRTTIINNYSYSRNVFMTGPRRSSVEVYTGAITPVRFRQSSRPGRTTFRNNEVSVFRPNVRRDESRRFAPRTVERFERLQGTRFDNRNTRTRDANISNPRNGNNLPQRERSGDRQFERRSDQPSTRPQGNDNRVNPRENRRNVLERNNERPTGRPDREMRRMEEPGNNSEARNNRVRGNEQPQRPTPQINERRQMEQPRQMERREVPGRQQMERREVPGRQQMERRQEQPRPQTERRQIEQPRQMERREVPGRQQMERRQEQPRPQQMERRQEQPRPQQMERRQEQPRQQVERQSSGNGNGRGNGRGRGN